MNKKKPKYINIKIRQELAEEIDRIVDNSKVYSTRIDVVKRALDEFFAKE